MPDKEFPRTKEGKNAASGNDSGSKSMHRRLRDVTTRIDKMSPDGEKVLQSATPVGTKRRSVGRALKIGSDMIAGVVVGGLIGYWLDLAFETRPVLFVLFFLLGIAAGLLNVLRTARQIEKEKNELVRQGKLDLGHDLKDTDEDD